MAEWGFHIGDLRKGGNPLRASLRPVPTLNSWIRWTAVAAILLLAFTATVQVAHSHANDKAADHCQICFAIHSAMPAEAASTGLVFTSVDQPAAELIQTAPFRFWLSPFANGPPVLKSV